MNLKDRATFAARSLTARVLHQPELGIVLGTGLGDLADSIVDPVEIPYGEIPYARSATVTSHAGTLVFGRLHGVQVVAMKGRLHYYEGNSLQDVTYLLAVMKQLGVNRVVITNACGAINATYSPGEIMVIQDHINFLAESPLRGLDISLGERFPHLEEAYTAGLRASAKRSAEQLGIKVHEGVYAWWPGPAIETPAEIRMLRTLGADAVGMSTVPEVILASSIGLEVLGLACLTNMAAGMKSGGFSGEDVMVNARSAGSDVHRILQVMLQDLD